MKLTLVIPCYNEERRLGQSFKKIAKFLLLKKIKTEIVFVNDGSSDHTLNLLETIKKNLKKNKSIDIKIVSYQKNRGKGYAVKMGIFEATGDNILLCDADLSTPIKEYEKLAEYINDYELVIGSRRQTNAQVIKPQSLARTFMGRSYSFFSKVTLRVNVNDFTCGFKLIRNSAAKKIAEKMLIDRWAYDSEILKIATVLKYKIKEVGISWYNDRGSKVRLLKDIFGSFRDLLKITFYSFLGKYE